MRRFEYLFPRKHHRPKDKPEFFRIRSSGTYLWPEDAKLTQAVTNVLEQHGVEVDRSGISGICAADMYRLSAGFLDGYLDATTGNYLGGERYAEVRGPRAATFVALAMGLRIPPDLAERLGVTGVTYEQLRAELEEQLRAKKAAQSSSPSEHAGSDQAGKPDDASNASAEAASDQGKALECAPGHSLNPSPAAARVFWSSIRHELEQQAKEHARYWETNLVRDLQAFADPDTSVDLSVESGDSFDSRTFVAKWTRRGKERQDTFYLVEGTDFVWGEGSGKQPYALFLASQDMADFPRIAAATQRNARQGPEHVGTKLHPDEGAPQDAEAFLLRFVEEARDRKHDTRERILFVRGAAGAGKTTLLHRLAATQASRFSSGQAGFLFLPLHAQAHDMSNLRDALTAELQALGADVTPHAALALCRRRLLVPMIDGLDALLGTAAYGDALGSLFQFLSELDGYGAVIVSGRPSFRDMGLVANAPSATHDRANYRITSVTLSPWSTEGGDGEPPLPADGQRRLLEEAAARMWQAGTRRLTASELRTLAESIAAEVDLPRDAPEQFGTGIAKWTESNTNASATESQFTFEPRLYFDCFLASWLGRHLETNTLTSSFLSHGILPEDTGRRVVGESPERAARVISATMNLAAQGPPNENTRRNVGQLLAAAFAVAGETRDLGIGAASFIDVSFGRAVLRGVTFTDCRFVGTQLEATVFDGCNAVNCHAERLVVSNETRLDVTGLLPGTSLTSIVGPGSGETRSPAEIHKVGRKLGAPFPRPRPASARYTRKGRRALKLLQSLVREFERTNIFRDFDSSSLEHYRYQLWSVLRKLLLEHGILGETWLPEPFSESPVRSLRPSIVIPELMTYEDRVDLPAGPIGDFWRALRAL